MNLDQVETLLIAIVAVAVGWKVADWIGEAAAWAMKRCRSKCDRVTQPTVTMGRLTQPELDHKLDRCVAELVEKIEREDTIAFVQVVLAKRCAGLPLTDAERAMADTLACIGYRHIRLSLIERAVEREASS